MKKKLLALMLTMAMVLGMSTTAMADDAAVVNEGKFVKTYTTENDGTAPAEVFTFNFTKDKAYDNEWNAIADITNVKFPVIDTDNVVTVEFGAITKDSAETDTKKTVAYDINIDGVEIGKYVYKVTEVDNNTAGITYNSGNKENLYLVVTVQRDENSQNNYVAAFHYEGEEGTKSGEINNIYKSGSLNVTKEITGNMADMDKTFPFEVVLKAPEGKTITNANASAATYTVAGEEVGAITFVNGEATLTFNLGDGETATFLNLPEGVTYTVKETNSGEYEQTVTGGDAVADNVASGTINSGVADAVEVVNDLSKTVDTGIIFNNLPYILALAVVAVAAIMFIRRRRFTEM